MQRFTPSIQHNLLAKYNTHQPGCPISTCPYFSQIAPPLPCSPSSSWVEHVIYDVAVLCSPPSFFLPSGCLLHPCSSRGGHCVETQCVSCSSRHWPACQGGSVFKEQWTFTTPTQWRPWGSWSWHWPSLQYTSSGQWYVVQGPHCSFRQDVLCLLYIKCNPAKCKTQQWTAKC